jgi:hypothetical protein
MGVWSRLGRIAVPRNGTFCNPDLEDRSGSSRFRAAQTTPNLRVEGRFLFEEHCAQDCAHSLYG